MSELAIIDQQAVTLYKSGMFTQLKNVEEAKAKAFIGREMGLTVYESLNGLQMIQGKPVLSAHLMAASIKKSGRYDYRVLERTDKVCRIEFYDQGESVGTTEFSIEDAKLAGISGGASWKKYPADMLFARAISRGFRTYCPDALNGSVAYVPGEIDPEPTKAETVEVTRVEAVEVPAYEYTDRDKLERWINTPASKKAREQRQKKLLDHYQRDHLDSLQDHEISDAVERLGDQVPLENQH